MLRPPTTDYGHPICRHKSDYRTSNNRAHRFLLSAERDFVPRNSRVLCNELHEAALYQPRSETCKEFKWKINSARNFREELAPRLTSVQRIHQFTDSINGRAPRVPLNPDASRFDNLPPEKLELPQYQPAKIDYQWRETHFTDTPGFFPLTDPLISTSELDFRLHNNYATARTNLIVRKEVEFNNVTAAFIPKTRRIINQFPFNQRQFKNEQLRDIAKFIPPSYDRIPTMRSPFVPFHGLTTEASSNYCHN